MSPVGDILGGLAQIGAIGAHGAYQGDVEGKVLGQRMRAEDTENQLRMLRLLQMQAQGNAPIGFGPGTMVFDPKTGMWNQVPFAPKQPVSLGPGHTLVDPATGRPLFSTPQAPAKPMTVSPGSALVNPDTGQPLYTAPAAPQRPVSVGPGHALVNPQTGQSLFTLAPTPQRPMVLGAGANLVDPATGRTIAQGQPRPVGGAGADKETVTTTTKITPRKPIAGDSANFKALNTALPDVIKELSAKPGFNVPGAYVTLPNGMRVRKEEIIAQAMLNKFGAEVQVRWVPEPTWMDKNAGRFAVVHAWEPAQREPVETRRRVGPPGSIPQADEEEE